MIELILFQLACIIVGGFLIFYAVVIPHPLLKLMMGLGVLIDISLFLEAVHKFSQLVS